MRKIVCALLIAVSLCSRMEIRINEQNLVTGDYLGHIGNENNGKSFISYFYAPGNQYLSINGEDQRLGEIFTLNGERDFELRARLPTFPEDLPYTGSKVQPKQYPFYFLELFNENKLAVISITPKSRAVHFPTHLPITYRVVVDDVFSDAKLILRGDDISMVKSVHVLTISEKGVTSKVKLEANKDNVFISPSLSYVEMEIKCFEIKLIEDEKNWNNYGIYLQAELVIPDEIYSTQIDNKPQYLSLGQVFRKKTLFRGYDEFLIEFPENLVELSNTFLSATAKNLVRYSVNKGRIHASLQTKISNNEEYFEIEFEFVVKELPKVTEPILIARYDMEELKNTNGFFMRGNFYDDKLYFKVSSETLLKNNVYFAFMNSNNQNDFISSKHQIAIGYDTLPASEFSDFHESEFSTNIVELEVDKYKAQKSKIVIISLKRVNNNPYEKNDSVSYFEVKITKDIYKSINQKDEVINYTLTKGQSIFISNHLIIEPYVTFFGDIFKQDYFVKVNKGQSVSYIRKIAEGSDDWKFSSLDTLFTYHARHEFTGFKSFTYRGSTYTKVGDPQPYGSIIVITAVSNEVSGSIITGRDARLEENNNSSLIFLN